MISLAKQGKYDHKAISIPKYLKKDGFHSLIIGQIRIDGNKFTIPYSRLFKKTHKPITITIPPVLLDKKIKQIEIIPKHHARFFEIQYKHEMPELINADVNGALNILKKSKAVDLSVLCSSGEVDTPQRIRIA